MRYSIKEARPIPDYGDLIPLPEFIEMCRCGSFTDDDGSGYLATDAQYMPDLPIGPSEARLLGKVPDDFQFSHVLWFNK